MVIVKGDNPETEMYSVFEVMRTPIGIERVFFKHLCSMDFFGVV